MLPSPLLNWMDSSSTSLAALTSVVIESTVPLKNSGGVTVLAAKGPLALSHDKKVAQPNRVSEFRFKRFTEVQCKRSVRSATVQQFQGRFERALIV